MKINSLAFRLVTTAAVWTLIALPVLGVILYSRYSSRIISEFDFRLRQHAFGLQADAIDGDGEPSRPKILLEPLFGVTNSGWYWQIKPYKGAPGKTYVSESLATGKLYSPHEDGADRTEGDIQWKDFEGPLGESLRVVELIGTVSEKQGATLYLFAVAGPLDWPRAEINDFTFTLSMALGLTGFALLVATLLQVKVALRPLTVIEKGLSDIRTGAAERLDGQYPAEIEPLQVELNALIESNEDIIERARTQVGNLAHALKTPLAVLTNEAEQTSSALGSKIKEQTSIMNNQVSYYLDRARMAARANTIGRVTPVLPVVRGLQRALERIHLEKGVQISVNCEDNLTFRGEKQDLEELLGNLLDNASKWSAGNVRLVGRFAGADRTQPGQWMTVTIEDDGPGVPDEARAAMVKRGKRLDETKPGSGLGLSIVNDLVTSYRGRLRLSTSRLGGLKAELTLPAVRS